MTILVKDETFVSYRSFSTPQGCTEFFITATGRRGASFSDALNELKEAYDSLLHEQNLSCKTLQFTRIYVSDIANEYQTLLKSGMYESVQSGAVSVVEQKPLCGSVSLISYHIKGKNGCLSTLKPDDETTKGLYTIGRFYDLLWTTASPGIGNNSCKQTEKLFNNLSSTYKKYGLTLRHNTVRSWIYVRDIDNNYKGMVDARRKIFTKADLSDKTRYIASTGIEGKMAQQESLVFADTLSIGKLKEQQVVRMEAPEHLSSTIVYGVTFERGLKIRFGDRSHMYISGTASIDKNGDIVCEKDIRGQTVRTIENIEALLRPHGATLEDMQYIIIYVRNRKQYRFIQDIITMKIPHKVPIISVEAAVCRPGWLIEMEGLAIINEFSDYPPFL